MLLDVPNQGSSIQPPVLNKVALSPLTMWYAYFPLPAEVSISLFLVQPTHSFLWCNALCQRIAFCGAMPTHSFLWCNALCQRIAFCGTEVAEKAIIQKVWLLGCLCHHCWNVRTAICGTGSRQCRCGCVMSVVGFARTVYIHRIWPYILWYPCQNYRIYTVYVYIYIYMVVANPSLFGAMLCATQNAGIAQFAQVLVQWAPREAMVNALWKLMCVCCS